MGIGAGLRGSISVVGLVVVGWNESTAVGGERGEEGVRSEEKESDERGEKAD